MVGQTFNSSPGVANIHAFTGTPLGGRTQSRKQHPHEMADRVYGSIVLQCTVNNTSIQMQGSGFRAEPLLGVTSASGAVMRTVDESAFDVMRTQSCLQLRNVWSIINVLTVIYIQLLAITRRTVPYSYAKPWSPGGTALALVQAQICTRSVSQAPVQVAHSYVHWSPLNSASMLLLALQLSFYSASCTR